MCGVVEAWLQIGPWRVGAVPLTCLSVTLMDAHLAPCAVMPMFTRQ